MTKCKVVYEQIASEEVSEGKKYCNLTTVTSNLSDECQEEHLV